MCVCVCVRERERERERESETEREKDRERQQLKEESPQLAVNLTVDPVEQNQYQMNAEVAEEHKKELEAGQGFRGWH